MRRVDVYIEMSTRYLGKKDRITGYILATSGKDGELQTSRQWFRTSGTYNRSTIVTITQALKRIKPGNRVVIHSDNIHTMDMIGNNLDAWKDKGFRDKKGNLIKNAEEWKAMAAAAEGKILESCHEKTHEYAEYMKWEIEKIKEKQDEKERSRTSLSEAREEEEEKTKEESKHPA